jgi:tetratricopeptide (TPR) repeat protein
LNLERSRLSIPYEDSEETRLARLPFSGRLPAVRQQRQARELDSAQARAEAKWQATLVYRRLVDTLERRMSENEGTEARIQVGRVHLLMEDHAAAERVLLEALKAEPRSAEANGVLGAVLAKKAQYKEAIPYLESALRADPDDFGAWSNLAEACYKLGIEENKDSLIDRAETEFRAILALCPHYVESHIGLGEVYSALAAHRKDSELYSRAIAEYEEGIRIWRSEHSSKRLDKLDLAAVHYSLGFARIQIYEAGKLAKDFGLLHKARRDFEECLSCDPAHAKAKRALEKINERLRSSAAASLVERFGPLAIFFPALLVLVLTQTSFVFDWPQSIETASYVGLTFGALAFMIAGLSLPQLLKLKVAGIELEKSSVDQVSVTSGSFGLHR